MAEGDCAAVHVPLLRICAEYLRRVEDDRGERFVQLDPLDVVDRLAGSLPRLLTRLCGSAGGVREVVRNVALGYDRRERLEPALLRELLADDDQRTGSVVDAGRGAGGGRPPRVENRV